MAGAGNLCPMKTTRHCLLAWIAAGLLASASAGFAQFIQPSTEATSKDAKIYGHVPSIPFSSDLSVTAPSLGAHFLSLVQFDLSQINAVNSEAIISAYLRLYSPGIGANGGVGGIVTISPILTDWRETMAPGLAPVATYDAFFGYTDVDDIYHPPTLFYGSPIASVEVTGAGFYEWDITTLVKSWYDNSVPNYGVLIQINTPNGDVGFADVDSAPGVPGSAPALVVVPEPSSSVAFLGGAGLLFLFRRRSPRLVA